MSSEERTEKSATLRAFATGSRVEVHHADGRVTRGSVVPAHEFSSPNVLHLKLDNGYNIGLRLGFDDRVEIIAGPPAENGAGPATRSEEISPSTAGWVALLTTGGTIASRVDYKTGGVKPVQREAEILEFYPNLSKDGPVRVVPVFDRLSEEIAPADWEELARRITAAFSAGARGVVVAHGTDTMGYTAPALSFLLDDLPGPVVLVGAQRSPDRPSSDGPSNLEAAVQLARHPALGEVVVVMHAGLSDDQFAVHRGTRVRKMHTSRRDAFQTRNGPPLGILDGGRLTFSGPFRERSRGPARLTGALGREAGILWFFPGLSPERARALTEGWRGVVLAGTGLGHVSSVHLPWIRSGVDRGVTVAMTSQCLEGEVDAFVYATGRELARAGVVYLGDMLPETAYVKLLWALGQTDDPARVRLLLGENRAGERSDRRVVEATP